jgi:uncharacterized protein YndB with AHSA1/START domain
MSVKKEASGRRSVQVEVVVPGTPEEVWQAIATGPGISSWFVPTEFEQSDGRPVAVTMNFGPGMVSRSAVTAWDPPRTFAAQGEGWGGSPPIATEWSVEARAGGVCLVRVVHSLFASTDDWLLPHPADLSHALPRPALRAHAVHGARRGNRSGCLGQVDRGIRTERLERRAAMDDARGCSVAQRRIGVRQPKSERLAGAARQAGVGRCCLRLIRHGRPDHGGGELLPLRRSGGRNRRPRDTAVASVDSRTLPDAAGDEQERMNMSRRRPASSPVAARSPGL